MIALKNVLVATDFSEAAGMALSYGRELARAFGARLHVVHVVQDLSLHLGAPEYTVTLTQLQSELQESERVRAEGLVSDDDRRTLRATVALPMHTSAAHGIVAYAREAEADLIVLGTHGRTGMERLFMGSVAEHVTRSAPCPVLVVRSPEREFVRPDALQTTTAA